MQSKLFIVVASAVTALASVLPRGDHPYPAGLVAVKYPNGLPDYLKPPAPVNGTEVAKREPEDLEKRATDPTSTGVYFCVDANFSGYCAHLVYKKNVCINLQPDLNDKVSSVGPDSDRCTFFSAFDCNTSEGSFAASYPGFRDLSSNSPPGPYWNDRISSYICYNA